MKFSLKILLKKLKFTTFFNRKIIKVLLMLLSLVCVSNYTDKRSVKKLLAFGDCQLFGNLLNKEM
jgi:hypothetical protein